MASKSLPIIPIIIILIIVIVGFIYLVASHGYLSNNVKQTGNGQVSNISSNTSTGFNQTQQAQAGNHSAQLAICAKAGVPASQCQNYCINSPTHCSNVNSTGSSNTQQGGGNSQAYNNSYPTNSSNDYSGALAACAKAGVSASNCQNYCQSNPSNCGITASGGGGTSGAGVNSGLPYSYTPAQLNANVIVANPVNLPQLASFGFAISKFRSCAGHDFPGFNFNGTYENESSMKHYFGPISDVGNFTNANTDRVLANTIQIFSPFNGTIVYDNLTLGATPYGQLGTGIVIRSNTDTLIGVTIFHIWLANGLMNGSVVTAGQFIGYAAGGPGRDGFDIALGMLRPPGQTCPWCSNPMANVWDSMFNHMAQQILAQYQQHEINQSNIIFSASARAAIPCNYVNDSKYTSASAGPHQTALWNFVNVT